MSRPPHELVIEPGSADRHYWRDLWHYRELLYVLAARDLSVRYKQMAIGVAWALLQPLLTMLVMTVVFGRVASLPSEGGAPYSILVLAGLLPWLLFAGSLSAASQSLVGNAQLISKVYFPRALIPASAMVVSLVDFLLSLLLLAGLMAWCGFWPSWRILTLPLFTLLALGAAAGIGLLITALNVTYRDFRYVIPFLVQFGLYVSPVGFGSSVVRARLGETLFTVYSLNPMVGVIEGFRWAILGAEGGLHWPSLGVSIGLVAASLLLGTWYFRRTEKSFADVI